MRRSNSEQKKKRRGRGKECKQEGDYAKEEDVPDERESEEKKMRNKKKTKWCRKFYA